MRKGVELLAQNSRTSISLSESHEQSFPLSRGRPTLLLRASLEPWPLGVGWPGWSPVTSHLGHLGRQAQGLCARCPQLGALFQHTAKGTAPLPARPPLGYWLSHEAFSSPLNNVLPPCVIFSHHLHNIQSPTDDGSTYSFSTLQRWERNMHSVETVLGT